MNKVRITDHCEITSSKRIYANEYRSSGVPFYRGKEITEKQLSSSEVSELLYISREKFEEIKSKYGIPVEGDLLLTSVGTIGNPYLVKEEEEFYFKDGNITWFRKFKNLDSKWLYYWLLSPEGKHELNKSTIGAAQPAYTIQLLSRMCPTLPSLPVQKAIADILSKHDSLILINQKKIEALEEMAQLLYREWFVEFRFPGYEKHNFVDSELGKIPEGWNVLKVKDVLQKYIGGGWGADEKNDIFDAPAYVIRGADIPRAKTGDFSECPLRFHKNSNFKSRKLIPGDIVFEVSGGSEGQPLGRAVIINEELLGSFEENVICASFCKLIRANKITSPEYLYLTLNHWGNTGQLAIYEVQSTGISNYQFEAFIKNVKMIIPDNEVLTQFSKLMNDIFKEIQTLGKINKTLRNTRDLLLPKLMSGEIDVSKLDIEITEN